MQQHKEKPILFNAEMVKAVLSGRKTQTRRVIKPQPTYENGDIYSSGLIGPELYEPAAYDRHGEMISGKEIFGAYTDDGEWGWKCPYGQAGDTEWQTGMPPSDGFYHVQTFDKPIYLRRMLKSDYQDVKEDGLLWGWNEFDDPEAIELADLIMNTIKWKKLGDRLWVRETWKAYARGAEWSPKVFYRASDPDVWPHLSWRPSIHMFREHSRINLEVTDIRIERVQEISSQDALAEGIKHSTLNDPCVEFQWLWDSINEKRGYGWKVKPWVWVVEFKVIKDI